MEKTAVHVLDLLRYPATKERDQKIIAETPLIINAMGVWGIHLHEALQETQRMKSHFGKNPIAVCEEGFLESQCLAIGCLSR